MSFLNPVSEPVKRFSSTDAGAPQINYNARVAGDVKTVLKACLVTGYGDKASAGWSVLNEVAHVAEFVSPSAAMSDYRLGIDDASAASTTWYYTHQNERATLYYNSPTKSFSSVVRSSPENGWQLLVADRGFVFIESLYLSEINKLSSRITYMGQIKSGLVSDDSVNMCFYNIGHSAQITSSTQFYGDYVHIALASVSSPILHDATYFYKTAEYTLNKSVVDVVSAIYISDRYSFVGQLTAMLSKVVNSADDMYGVAEVFIDGRPCLQVTAGQATSISDYLYARGRVFLIPIDYWEY